MDNVDRFEKLSATAQGIRGIIIQREIKDDGTIVEMRHGETAIAALRRHARIRGRHDVRRWQEHAPALFRQGLVYIDGARIKLANFEALQSWQHKRGPVPSFYVETLGEFDPIAVFDESIGAMVSELAPYSPPAGSSTAGAQDPAAGQPQPPIEGIDEAYDTELTPAEQRAVDDADGIPDFGKGAL